MRLHCSAVRKDFSFRIFCCDCLFLRGSEYEPQVGADQAPGRGGDGAGDTGRDGVNNMDREETTLSCPVAVWYDVYD